MTTYVTASHANRRFSYILRRVKQGEDFVVTLRGDLVARILPPENVVKPTTTPD
jgi:prevent-host-death family protein